jgi:cell division protein FtsL
MAERTEFDRGKEEGRVDEVLRQHGQHLARINGSIDDSTQALSNLAGEIRELREDSRLREERVVVAAETLATETERRRSELADTATSADRAFTRREKVMGLALSLAVGAVAVLQYLQ